MYASLPTATQIRASYARVRSHIAAPEPILVLHFGDEEVALAYGTQTNAEQMTIAPLRLKALAESFLPAGQMSPLTVEHAIADVEDVVMSWQDRMPTHALLCTADPTLGCLAQWAGMPSHAVSWHLSTEAVEALFNRWIDLIQGRPASQDHLPDSGRFAVSLLVLREWLHHREFQGITIVNQKKGL